MDISHYTWCSGLCVVNITSFGHDLFLLRVSCHFVSRLSLWLSVWDLLPFKIKLMYMLLSLNCYRNNDLNGNWIDYGTECIILTNTLYLKETFYNMTIFVTFNVTIDVMYNIEYPFIINNIYIRLARVRIYVPVITHFWVPK